jgi:putative ABC transport system permease protein
MLNNDHIDFIIKDLHKRGLLLDNLKDEITDHVCSAVEERMAKGVRFADAYEQIIEIFGNTAGLQETQKQTAMLQNFFVVAFRNLKKQRFYTSINIAGLAVGVASCLIITLYVFNELSYDKHFADYDRIYRVETELNLGDNHQLLTLTPAPMSDVMQKDFPEVETSARFWNPGPQIFRRSAETFKVENTVIADGSIFDVFEIPFIEGDPKTALVEPLTMVMSRGAAEKYFPGESALNQVLESKYGLCRITGIMENIPSNTHFNFDVILSLANIKYGRDTRWLWNQFHTYLKLKKGVDAGSLEAKFPGMIETYANAPANQIKYTLLPLADVHLNADRYGQLGVNSNIIYVYLFGAIAVFVLLIACINFMNLSTARSASRAKEVGIRKVMGSFGSHLVKQFLVESVLLSMCSFVIAIVTAWLFIPWFNELALKDLSLPFDSWIFWILIVAAALLIGLLAGLYPSLFLSAFTPASVLKGNVSRSTKSGGVRGVLVVFQFWISIVLIVGTIAVNQQLSYIQTKKIGFKKDQVIIVHDAFVIKDQLKSFKDEVEKDRRIMSGTITGFIPVDGNSRRDDNFWRFEKSPTDDNIVTMQNWAVDQNYVKTMGMKIVEGRDFSLDFLSDSNAVILNQAAVKSFGLSHDPVGKKIVTYKDAKHQALRISTIIGVVEDFHYESLRENIGPLSLFLESDRPSVSFRFEAKNTNEVIALVEENWRKIGAGVALDYSFLDEDFGKMYASEQRLGKIFTVFAGLTIIIACLGLFALTAFTAEQRTKEIGIRKVLGATVSGIVVLLSKEFGKLILIAFVLAAPVAWFAIDHWLESYTYRTEISVFVYLIAGAVAFCVAWLTTSFQSIKAALTNPIKSLRSE